MRNLFALEYSLEARYESIKIISDESGNYDIAISATYGSQKKKQRWRYFNFKKNKDKWWGTEEIPYAGDAYTFTIDDVQDLKLLPQMVAGSTEKAKKSFMPGLDTTGLIKTVEISIPAPGGGLNNLTYKVTIRHPKQPVTFVYEFDKQGKPKTEYVIHDEFEATPWFTNPSQ